MPDRQGFSSKLPDKFIAQDLQSTDAIPLWGDSFDDKTLKRDAQTLWRNNFELEAARARIEQAAASYGISRADLFPTLDATSDFERARTKADGNTDTENTISFGAALNWELDIWGRVRAKKEASRLNLEEQKALLDQTTLNLQTILVESWLSHHAAQKLNAVLRQQEKTNKDFLELTELRLSQSQGSALDVLQQRGRLAATQSQIPAVRAQIRRSANAYDVLMGVMPDGQMNSEARWMDIKPLKAVPNPAQLMLSRPDLRAAFSALQSADNEVAAAIADRLPKISLGLSYNLSGNTLSNIGDGKVLSFTSGLLAPLFDGGRRKAEVLRRKGQVNEALADLEQAMLLAVREVEDRLGDEVALFEELRLLEKEQQIAAQTIEKARLRYMNGQENYLSVLNALENQQQIRQREITLRRDVLINRARLLKALGAQWAFNRADTPPPSQEVNDEKT